MPGEPKKKVVQHYLYSGLGGHGGVFFSLVEADKQHEFEFRALFCGIEPLREEYRENCSRLNVPFHYIKKKRGFDFGSYFSTFRIFRKNRPDVIFIHGVSYSIIPAFWYKLTRPRTRIIVRDTQAHHLKSRAEWFWMFFCLRMAKRIIFLTRASAEGIRKKFGWWANRKKFVIIPNGLKMELYSPLRNFEFDKQVEIGMQSRMQPIKDHPVLLKAFKLVKEMNPGISMKLQIAGDGETLPAIQSLAAELGIADAVQFHGMLNGAALVSMMGSLDIYVHATKGETLSNAIMQAMACGLPIVASDVWGVNNMITDDQNGLLYEPGSVEALAEKLNELIREKDKRKRLGNTARKYAEQHYDNAAMFRSYKEQF